MANSKVAILTDSTADIPKNLVDEYGIEVIPLNVIWDGTSYKDNIDISSDEFYKRLKTAKELPTTSQPSVGAFKEYYDRIAPDVDGIVVMCVSDKLSGTIASAKAARDQMSDFPIEIVDSKTTVAGLALVVLEAAKAAKEGKDLEAVAARAREVSGKMKTMFLVDTLEFLHKGGRIGGAKRFVGSLLSVKPILHILDGSIDTLDSVRTKKKAMTALVEIAKGDIGQQREKVFMGVFHGLAEEEGKQIMAQVKELFSPEELLFTGLSPVIGVHTGPGTIGLAYFVD
jgi:DegV family protein with EDD domain